MEQKLHPVLSVRLFTDEKCFGPGVAALLTLVKTCHSLRAEAQLVFKLLLSTTGGKHGGGAQLTEQGEALLAAYARYCQTLRDFAQRQFAADFADFL